MRIVFHRGICACYNRLTENTIHLVLLSEKSDCISSSVIKLPFVAISDF